MSREQKEVYETKELQKLIPVWQEEFGKASIDRKKMLLRLIIDRITVRRYEISIDVKLSINGFMSGLGAGEDDNGEST
ncbi:hypothetical protein [Natranaerobius thermophilus]|uniref:Uncharacterized protein n=1 Tax=Natranaerobius thermophilus (strain ATCC BAA-1301 / DSM 18059 / JW/NM-WN-LF) TaxID=457570 RepID=B2A6Y3_NATTJ|nr:hypothetical protein [Natranaerobius thermophilus]ACB85574.1 hypothetical protein Nther_2007 [Natranaerobius thermophilus JW/NM-WN-LF]